MNELQARTIGRFRSFLSGVPISRISKEHNCSRQEAEVIKDTLLNVPSDLLCRVLALSENGKSCLPEDEFVNRMESFIRSREFANLCLHDLGVL